MPKRIPELRQAILASARRHVLEDAQHDVTMRQIAQDCQVALGTVYNYYASKEELLADAMMGDWLECCRRMREGADAQAEPILALQAIVEALRGFTERYRPLWRHYEGASGSLAQLHTRRDRIIQALADCLVELLARTDLLYDPCVPEALAELLLLASRTPDGFARLRPVLERVLKR